MKRPPSGAQVGQGGQLMGLNTSFRKQLDLFANVVRVGPPPLPPLSPPLSLLLLALLPLQVRSLPGVVSRHRGIDTVIVREQTEGEYSAIEHQSVPGVVECLKVVTRAKSTRYFAFPHNPCSTSSLPLLVIFDSSYFQDSQVCVRLRRQQRKEEGGR